MNRYTALLLAACLNVGLALPAQAAAPSGAATPPAGGGTVIATVDGATWKQLPAPTLNQLRAVAFPDLDHAWLAGLGGTILANAALIPSCTSVSITPDTTSPEAIGTIVTLTAEAAGCPDPNPLYRFYLRSPSGVWSIVRNFSASNTFAWHTSTYGPGTYLIGVWVKDSHSGFTYDAYALGTFTLQRMACNAVKVESQMTSPQVVGNLINFGVTVFGCPAPRYQWLVRNKAGVWSTAVPYSTDYTFAWNTAGLPEGTYQIGVWARQQGSSKPYEAYGFVTFTLWGSSGTGACQAVNIAYSPDSPSHGLPVTLTATAFGCDTPQYKWWVRNTAAHWTMVKNYSTSNTYVWPAQSRPAGTYLLGVWVRQAGSTASYEAYSLITYSITFGPGFFVCTSVNIAPDLASPQAPGTTITFTASSNGCIGPNFQFWILPPGGTWTIVQPYAGSNTYVWNTAGLSPGPWQVGVWVREAGSTASYQAFAFITFQLTFG